ncbi:hypothetical protein PIROE2DRAFT_65150, partial [Piromyces sp. E2]
DLSVNKKLVNIPDNIYRLTNLKQLYLGETGLKQIPNNLYKLKLEDFDINHTPGLSTFEIHRFSEPVEICDFRGENVKLKCYEPGACKNFVVKEYDDHRDTIPEDLSLYSKCDEASNEVYRKISSGYCYYRSNKKHKEFVEKMSNEVYMSSVHSNYNDHDNIYNLNSSKSPQAEMVNLNSTKENYNESNLYAQPIDRNISNNIQMNEEAFNSQTMNTIVSPNTLNENTNINDQEVQSLPINEKQPSVTPSSPLSVASRVTPSSPLSVASPASPASPVVSASGVSPSSQNNSYSNDPNSVRSNSIHNTISMKHSKKLSAKQLEANKYGKEAQPEVELPPYSETIPQNNIMYNPVLLQYQMNGMNNMNNMNGMNGMNNMNGVNFIQNNNIPIYYNNISNTSGMLNMQNSFIQPLPNAYLSGNMINYNNNNNVLGTTFNMNNINGTYIIPSSYSTLSSNLPTGNTIVSSSVPTEAIQNDANALRNDNDSTVVNKTTTNNKTDNNNNSTNDNINN